MLIICILLILIDLFQIFLHQKLLRLLWRLGFCIYSSNQSGIGSSLVEVETGDIVRGHFILLELDRHALLRELARMLAALIH